MRVKFKKEGPIRFIGHLDLMRYFQKALRRAKLPVAFSMGYNPHMILSFGSPLGLGLTSEGEYFDVELTEDISSREMISRLQNQMVEGVEILGAVEIISDKKETAMAQLEACDYLIARKDGQGMCTEEELLRYMEQDGIFLLKKTKRSESMVDIKPMIYEVRLEEEKVFLKIASGSRQNLQPLLWVEGLEVFLGNDFHPHNYEVRRMEMYARKEDGTLISLLNLGKEV